MRNYVYAIPLYHWGNPPPIRHMYPLQQPIHQSFSIQDYGNSPFTINMQQAAQQNNTFRTALWTGDHLQVTLMSIDVGDDIGLEAHHDVDQFLYVEDGYGLVQMGPDKNHLDFVSNVTNNSAIMVPAGTWHNLTNTGNTPLKIFSIYAPPEHPKGTIHLTKADDHEHH